MLIILPCRMLISNEDQNVFSQKPKSLSKPSSVNQKPDTSLLLLSKQHNPFEESPSGADIGLISSDSLLSPPRNSFADNISFISTPKPNDQQVESNPLRQLIDDHQPNSCGTAVIVEETQPDTTHLSMSIRRAGSDLPSSTSSDHYNLALSPIKLLTEYDPAHTGLGVGLLNEVYQRQTTGKPVSREHSMSGPLGEVLTSTNSTFKDESKNFSSSSLNLMADVLDSSFRLVPLPTGVLQKTSFGSLSCSTGRSRRVDTSKLHDSTNSMCNNHLGPTFVNASAVSSM